MSGTTTIDGELIIKDGTQGNIGDILKSTGVDGECSWEPIGAVGSGESVLFEVTQSSHGFTAANEGEGFYHDGADWVQAQANDPETLATHIFAEYLTANTFRLASQGKITVTAHGYTPLQEWFFVDPDVPGVPTATEPTLAGQYSNPLFYTLDANTLIVAMYRPSAIGEEVRSNVDIIRSFFAYRDGDGDFSITSADSTVPDFGAAQSLAGTLADSSAGDALYSNFSAAGVYHYSAAASSQYDAFGFVQNIPAYARGKDVGLGLQYRTKATAASADGDYMMWVFDNTNGKTTTTTDTGLKTAGTSIVVGSSTGMAVGDKIWIGEAAQVIESHITAIADGTHVTLANDVTLASGDRFTTGILTDVLTTFNAADSDTDEAGTKYKLNFKPPADCLAVTVMIQQLTSVVNSEIYFDGIEITTDPFKSIATQKKPSFGKWDGYAGYSSSNTKSPYFTNERTNTLSSTLSVTNDGTDGFFVEALETCNVSFTLSYYKNAGATQPAWTLNPTSAELDAAVTSLDATKVLAFANLGGDTARQQLNYEGHINKGDKIHLHCNDTSAFETSAYGFNLSVTATPLVNQSVIVESQDALAPSVLSFTGTNASLQSSTTEIRFESGLDSADFSNNNFLIVEDDSGNTRTKFTAVRNCTIVLNYVGGQTAQNDQFGVYVNGSLVHYGNQGYAVASTSSVEWTGELASGDYITIYATGTHYTAGGSHYLAITANPLPSELHKPLLALPTITYGGEPEEFLVNDAAGHPSSGDVYGVYFNSAGIQTNTISNLGTVTEGDSTTGAKFTATQRCVFTGSATYENTATVFAVALVKNGDLTQSTSGSNNIDNLLGYAVNDTSHSMTASGTTILEPGDTVSLLTGESTNMEVSNNVAVRFSFVVSPIQGVTNQAAIISQPVAIASYVSDTADSYTANDWRTMSFNTLDGDIADTGISISSNQVTFPAGKYKIRGRTRIYCSANANRNCGFRLRNITDSNDVESNYGSFVSYPINATYGGSPGFITFRTKVVTFTKTTTVEVQVYPTTSTFDDGPGNSAQVVDFRRELEITRMK